MSSRIQNRMTVAVAVGVPLVIAAWLLTPANTAVPSTYVFLAMLVIAMALVGLVTWDNGLAAGSLAQVIHDVDVTPSTGPDVSASVEDTGASRWTAWQFRGDALAATGRMRALLALSAALTTALLLYAWVR